MNRFDILLGKKAPSKKENKKPFSDFIMGVDVGSGESKSVIATFFQSAIGIGQVCESRIEIEQGVQVQVGDQVGINKSGQFILARDYIKPVAVVTRIESPLSERQQPSNRGPLHEHPLFQGHLNLDADHVVVDRNDWERARVLLLRNDSSSNIHSIITGLPQERPLVRTRIDSSSGSSNIGSINLNNDVFNPDQFGGENSSDDNIEKDDSSDDMFLPFY